MQNPYNGHCRKCYAFKGRTSGECVDSECKCHQRSISVATLTNWADDLEWNAEYKGDNANRIAKQIREWLATNDKECPSSEDGKHCECINIEPFHCCRCS
jgi:hypothetical protein